MTVGRYETLRSIASGGMATVHLGRAVGAGGFERLFAIKIMHAHLASEPEFVRMFLDEARLAARIRHANVVGTMDIVEADSGLALVMEYVEGPTLQGILKLLRKEKVLLPLDIGLRILSDVLHGLDAAHELTDGDGRALHLVHRDVSPQNLLVGVDGVTKITDFGVAHAESRLSSTRGAQVKGKLAYMTPEQVSSSAIDRRTDVYSAGIVFWEMLAGKRLFEADNDAALLSAITDGATQSPRELVAAVPEGVNQVCMRALEYSPDDRYESCAEFAEALESAAFESGIRLANRRKVGEYVRSLKIHRDPLGIPTAAPSSPTGRFGSLADASAPSSPAAEPSTGSSPSAVTARGVADGSTKISIAMSDAPPLRSGRRNIIVGAVGAALAVGIIAAVLLGSSASTAPPNSASLPPDLADDLAEASVDVDKPSIQRGAPALASAEPGPDRPHSSPSATASAATSAAVPASSVPSPPAQPAPPSSKKGPAVSGKTPKTSATSFNTMDL